MTTTSSVTFLPNWAGANQRETFPTVDGSVGLDSVTGVRRAELWGVGVMPPLPSSSVIAFMWPSSSTRPLGLPPPNM
ncbi:hypothetical protein [Kribbella sp. C-35]|uniref:hypothetical protein n=1 Tax=Kribbella sp. C-35 TaxID=2789276 RepID=UPI00397ABAEC